MKLNSLHILQIHERMKTRKPLSIAAVWHLVSTGAFEYPTLSSGNKNSRRIIPSFTNLKFQRPFSNCRTQHYSSMIDESSTIKNTMEKIPLPTGCETVASGSVLSCSLSSNLRDSIMVVKLREEDLTLSDETSVQRVEDRALSTPASLRHSTNTKKNKTQGDDFTGKSVLFSNGRQGVVVAQRPPLAFVLCDFQNQDTLSNNENDVAILNTRIAIQVSNSLIGKTVNYFGRVVDVKKDGSVTDCLESVLTEPPFTQRDIFTPIPQVKDISLINSPFLTGTAMIDALAPIGRGQNMLLVGEEGLGQREILLGAIKTQIREMKSRSSQGITCIYALTTLDNKERAYVIENLQRAGLLDHIILVTTRDHHQHPDSPQTDAAAYAESVAVAATACALGEAFALSKSHNCAVFVDNLNQHKKFWDWTTNALVSVYGAGAVVKADLDGGASSEMRAFYSALIQRAARFNRKNGNGSVTLILLTNIPSIAGHHDDLEHMVFTLEDFAHLNQKIKERVAILDKKRIPLTPSNLRKINIPLPVESDAERRRRLALQYVDDLISMTDGQIWLDEKLFANGQRPAMDPQRSITRVGIGADTDSRADAPIIRKIVGGLRFEFAQASSLDGVEKGETVNKQLLMRDAYLLAMSQDSGSVRRLSETCVLLLAASIGGLDSLIQKGKSSRQVTEDYVVRLVQYVEPHLPSIMVNIDNNMDSSPYELDQLRKVILEYATLN